MTTNRPDTLTGSVVIVTGAGKGLGRAYAVDLARRGAHVVVNNRFRPELDAGPSADTVVELIRQTGGEAVANYEHVEDPASGERMVQQALDHFGRLDAVITNAGIDEERSFHKLAATELRRVFEINFFGSVWLAHAAYQVMREQRYGRLLLNSSGAGLYGNHGLAGYSSSKAALLGLMRTLSIEGINHDVRVNAIAPYAATQMTAAHIPEPAHDALQPQYVAPLAAWLVSPGCKQTGRVFISGAGRVRVAAVRETASIEFDSTTGLDELGTELAMLCEAPLVYSFSDARTEFLDLIS